MTSAESAYGFPLPVSTNMGYGFPSIKNLLLDTYSGAAAAYSLRKLRTAYTGAAIRVRRSSDSVESDIGFTSTGALDETSLTTFIGANSGFVTTWYDQSGNTGRNAAQTTAASQPRIVNAGVIERRNGKPALRFPANMPAYKFDAPNTNWIYFGIVSYDNAAGLRQCYGYNGGGYQTSGIYMIGPNTTFNRAGGTSGIGATGSYVSNSLLLFGTQYLSNNTGIGFLNANTSAPASALINGSPYTSGGGFGFGVYGASAGTFSLDGHIAEHIAYQVDNTANINNIKININSYYAIY